MRIITGCLLPMLAAIMACSDSNDGGAPTTVDVPFAGFTSPVYRDTDKWLCHPALPVAENICASNLDTTIVFANGATAVEPHVMAQNPQVDCFYVYPTVSADDSGNSDLLAGAEEYFTTLNQAARYSSFCRVFAPIYRQVTVNVIISDQQGDREVAYGDVLDSFKHYMSNHNQGRGYVLIGHSQGAGHLSRLLAETIEPDAVLRERMIAAHILGSSVRTVEGSNVVSGTNAVELCRAADQTGCVVTYVSYREGDAFVADGSGRFGQPLDGETSACTNPGALAGGSVGLRPYFPVASNPQLDAFIIPRTEGPFADAANAAEITTPFYSMPGFLEGQCTRGPTGIGYLRVGVNADPSDPRADDFNGEMILQDWGLHLVDMTVAMGNLVELGAGQAASWVQSR
ncbi:MAG: DUF3089 domain-containing protein [Halioglobus sp.]|nr:DUF3089 domain-containing protein [Halioglobus sp.]